MSDTTESGRAAAIAVGKLTEAGIRSVVDPDDDTVVVQLGDTRWRLQRVIPADRRRQRGVKAAYHLLNTVSAVNEFTNAGLDARMGDDGWIIAIDSTYWGISPERTPGAPGSASLA